MNLDKKNIYDKFCKILIDDNFVKAIASKPLSKDIPTKIILRPVLIKCEKFYQKEHFVENKAMHKNIGYTEINDEISDILDNYGQVLIVEAGSDHQILKNKQGFVLKTTSNSVLQSDKTHDNKKNYILADGIPVPFLIKLKIMDENGNVFKTRYDKFKQINKYLEFINGTISELKSKKLIKNHIKAVDFGCGKSYLTFALQYYLDHIEKMSYSIIGLDLKKDVIQTCTDISQDLKCKNLEFMQGDIKDFHKLNDVDLIFSLHACNNATDYSILKGLELNAKAILAVPCCQHEFNQKMSSNKKGEFFFYDAPIGKHGILMEKYTSLATDAFRALALELCGYKVQVMEFIDMEHTPKNIIIKGIKSNASAKELGKIKEEYMRFKNYLGIEPILDELLNKYYLV